MTREPSRASPVPSAPTFALPELPYPSSALEPHISARTIETHHGKHHKAYVDKANELVTGTAIEGLPLGEAVIEARRLGIGPLFNNIAQIYNHNLFWQSMTPGGAATPRAGPLLEKINASAGSIDAFKAKFVKAGSGQFGSGWIWVVDDGGTLEIINTANAEAPLTDGKFPLLVCDVWEHAYYLDYQNRREEFLEVFVDKLANWAFAERRLAESAAARGAASTRAGARPMAGSIHRTMLG